MNANEEFWAAKIAEAEAGDGTVTVRLGDIPKVPDSRAVYVLPGDSAAPGRRLSVTFKGSGDFPGTVITEDSPDVVLSMTVTPR